MSDINHYSYLPLHASPAPSISTHPFTMRFSVAFAFAALPLLAAAAPVDVRPRPSAVRLISCTTGSDSLPVPFCCGTRQVSAAKLVNSRAGRSITISTYSEQLARDIHYKQPAPISSSTDVKIPRRGEHVEAESPKMEDGYDAAKTNMDETDHSLAYMLSDDRVPTAVGYPAKSAADGTTHTVDSGVTSDADDKDSPKGQAEGHGNDTQGSTVEANADGEGAGQGL